MIDNEILKKYNIQQKLTNNYNTSSKNPLFYQPLK